MMTHSEAEILLHRYFEGTTSLNEEMNLREYFRAGDVHPDLAELNPMFAYWDKAAKVMAPPVKRTAMRRRMPLRWFSTAAAAILLLFAAGTWFNYLPSLTDVPIAQAKTTTIAWSKYEFTDPAEAYIILRHALAPASAEMTRSPRLTNRALR